MGDMGSSFCAVKAEKVRGGGGKGVRWPVRLDMELRSGERGGVLRSEQVREGRVMLGDGALRSLSLSLSPCLGSALVWKRRHDSRCKARRSWRLDSRSSGLGCEDGVRDEVVTARRCE